MGRVLCFSLLLSASLCFSLLLPIRHYRCAYLCSAWQRVLFSLVFASHLTRSPCMHAFRSGPCSLSFCGASTRAARMLQGGCHVCTVRPELAQGSDRRDHGGVDGQCCRLRRRLLGRAAWRAPSWRGHRSRRTLCDRRLCLPRDRPRGICGRGGGETPNPRTPPTNGPLPHHYPFPPPLPPEPTPPTPPGYGPAISSGGVHSIFTLNGLS